MKLPEKIKGRNRIRDAAIVAAFKIDRLEYSQIAEKFKLTERRILQILSTNHAFIKVNKEWEKEKRIARLEKWLKDAPAPRTNALEIQAELRKEIEGDSLHVDASKHLHQTYVWINQSSTDSVSTPRLSERDSLPSS